MMQSKWGIQCLILCVLTSMQHLKAAQTTCGGIINSFSSPWHCCLPEVRGGSKLVGSACCKGLWLFPAWIRQSRHTPPLSWQEILTPTRMERSQRKSKLSSNRSSLGKLYGKDRNRAIALAHRALTQWEELLLQEQLGWSPREMGGGEENCTYQECVDTCAETLHCALEIPLIIIN